MKRPLTSFGISLLTVASLALGAHSAKAELYSWTSASAGFWDNSNNWSTSTGAHEVPVASGTIRINTTSTNTSVTINTVASAATVQLGNLASANKGIVFLTNGGTLTVSGGMSFTSENTGATMFIQDGGHASFGAVQVGRINVGTSAYMMQGGTMEAATLFIGGISNGNGSGTFAHTGGYVKAGTLNINSSTTGINNNAHYLLSGGTLEVTGNTVFGGTSQYNSFQIAGSTGTILLRGNYTQNNKAHLQVRVDNGGLTKLNLTSVTGTATLSGTLSAGIKGPAAFTSSETFRVVEAQNIVGDFSGKPNATLWETSIQTDVDGTRDAYVLSYNSSANVGGLIGGGEISFTATDVGYATLGGLTPGSEFSLYLDAYAGNKTTADLVAYFTANGFTASLVDFEGYNVLLTLDPVAATSYFAWDLNEFDSLATFSGLSVVPEPGTMTLMILGSLGVLAWRKRRA